MTESGQFKCLVTAKNFDASHCRFYHFKKETKIDHLHIISKQQNMYLSKTNTYTIIQLKESVEL